MSPTRVCFFTFLVFVGIAVQFAVCKDDAKCDEKIIPGSNRTSLGKFETIAKFMMDNFEAVKKSGGKLGGKFGGKFGGMFGKDKKDEPKSKCSSFGDMMEKIQKHVVIAPGTLWCGGGNIAKNDGDLGCFKKTDACCRAHDMCNNNIEAGEQKLNLINNGLFTRSACSCDSDFYDCLKEAKHPMATNIALTYFDLLHPQCFTCMCPTNTTTDGSADNNDGCKKYEWKDNCKVSSNLKKWLM